MEQLYQCFTLSPTDTVLTLTNGESFVLRTDAPTTSLIDNEFDNAVERAIVIHNSFMGNLTKEISADSYIQIGSTDNVIIADEASRISVIYRDGSFCKFSPMFYLDWLDAGMLLEVTVDEDKLARFVYKK